MSPRLRARAPLVVALLVLVTMLAPLAAADHAYSHRYIVFGRVVDANGDPVPNVTLSLRYHEFTPESQCGTQPGTETESYGTTQNNPPWIFPQQPVLAYTDSYGQFIFCFHTHQMSRTLPGGATVVVQGHNITKEITFDALTRNQFLGIELPTVEPTASKEARDTSVLVYGRLWRPESGEPFVENIRVFGHTLNHVNVSVTLTLPDGSKLQRNATTNNYGDFAVRVNTTARVSSGTVEIQAENQTFTQALDGKLGVAAFRAEFPKKADPFVRNLLIALGVVAGVAVVGGGGWWGYRRMQAAREEKLVRERSQRKRANK